MSPSPRLPNRIALSEDMRRELRDHAARTGIGAMAILKGVKDKPDGLRASVIDNWLYGRVASVRPEHFAYVLARWLSLPDNLRIPLTPEMSASLNAEMMRTGMGPVTILKNARACPPGLSWQVIQSLATETVNTVSVEQWDYLLRRLRGLPDQSGEGQSHLVGRQTRQEILEGDLSELKIHRKRTGIGGAVLLRNASDIPTGLTPAMISNWLSGTAKTARPEHVAYVLALYRTWP